MARLILTDGKSVYNGQSFGAEQNISGEIVFQIGMVGYVESLTDPSYRGQIVVFTYPLIGNYGVPKMTYNKDGLVQPPFQSDRIQVRGVIVSEYIEEVSHWTAIMSLSEWLIKEGIPAISGIDTRALTKKLRENGMTIGEILQGDSTPSLNIEDPNIFNLAAQVSCKEPIVYNETGSPTIVVIDCGVKYGIIHNLLDRNAKIIRVPWNYDWTMLKYDGILISNGPGDPISCVTTIEMISQFINSPTNNPKPLFGICLGNQILGLAIGASTYKMKYGNRSFNQPCVVDKTHSILTAQNHGFALNTDNLPSNWISLFYNANDNTNEGIIHTDKPFFSVQFHPEGCAGPRDAEALFAIFLDAVNETKNGAPFNIKKSIYSKFASISDIKDYTKSINKVLLLGSGGLSIGQAGEFDYSGSQALKALKEEHIQTILVNPNIATVQTSKGSADKIYFVPITPEYVIQVIEAERPDGIILSFGGQTALNCGVALYDMGILHKYNIQVLGTSVDSIRCTEDRLLFAEKLESVNEHVAFGRAATSLEEAIECAEEIGYPVLVRADFALGGLGSGFGNNRQELVSILSNAFLHCHQVFIDRSLKGWKEIEYEVMRDAYGNAVTICNMENLDPVGIHTGESIVVAPSQTLTDQEYQKLRSVAIKIAHHLAIVGECNIQFAVNPLSDKYYIIEVNARLSRSSALASKATGYPIAYIAAKLSLNIPLTQLKNTVTGNCTACFEPSLDYITVKVPRWDFGKFAGVSTKIGSSMKSVGEAMAIGRKFEEALQKALRMCDEKVMGLDTYGLDYTKEDLSSPSDKRIYSVAAALKAGISIEELSKLAQIDPWFLNRINNIVAFSIQLEDCHKKLHEINPELILKAKQLGFSDKQIARYLNTIELSVRKYRIEHDIHPFVKQIDTVSGEYPAFTNYLYLTYSAIEHDITFNSSSNNVLVLGSGVYRIGSSVEFDWCAVGCIRELKKLSYSTIMVNNNPETVSTDYDECNRLYFEELSFETVLDIYSLEHPFGVIISTGGQLPNNIALALHRQHVKILGTSPEMIDTAENRFKFSRLLDSIQVKQPEWKEVKDLEAAIDFCNSVGYPCLIRPSYVLSGAAMNVAVNSEELETFLQDAKVVSRDYPIVISRFIQDAKEIDIDAVAQNGKVLVVGIAEHVENAGVHSGDATLITPPQDLNATTLKLINKTVTKIAQALHVSGPFNLQLIAKEDQIKVIECNLRVSRSFPFISKTLDIDLVALATQVIMGIPSQPVSFKGEERIERVGVKVPQFSFSRLEGADCKVGVEMCSTGEVACFGENHYEAYLKALLSRGFKLPNKTIFLSIGTYKAKRELLESVKLLENMGYELYGSSGTADFYSDNNIAITDVPWPNTELTEHPCIITPQKTTSDYFTKHIFDLVINLPKRAYLKAPSLMSHGYRIRRLAVAQSVPIIVDIKSAKLLVQALYNLNKSAPLLKTVVDCITTHKIIRLPGLIDTHVHTRDPGQTHKEDFYSCTCAALAGGITLIGAMPNTNPAIVDYDTFKLAMEIATQKACCDFGIYVGASNTNAYTLGEILHHSIGLKMYLNKTFTTLQLEDMSVWRTHMEAWPAEKPLCVHAEQQTMAAAILLSELCDRPIHICHVARKDEIELIKHAKMKGIPVTCEVCPHHLFLSDENISEFELSTGGRSEVRPSLATKADLEALWENLDIIDCFATDHAPHTLDEKDSGSPPPGFPGLETMLPLLLNAVNKGKLSIEDIVTRLHTNPRRIFNLPLQPDTYIEVDLDEEWHIPQATAFSKAGWTPFAGMKVKGVVKRVLLRGNMVFVDGKILASPGYGKNIIEPKRSSSLSPILLQSEATPLSALLGAATVNLSSPTIIPQVFNKFVSQLETPDSAMNTRSASPDLMLSTDSWRDKHVLSVEQFNRDQLHSLFQLAHEMRISVKSNGGNDRLKGRVLGSLFYEASTRTSCSFLTAMQRLGGSVIDLKKDMSSHVKGESLEDTIRMLSSYCDVLVLRHPEKGVCQRVSKFSSKPLINAGDGTGEHPTQALLDIFTIREEIGTVNGLNITLAGDLKHGRTVHSLVKLLSLYNVNLIYVAPPNLSLPTALRENVTLLSDGRIKQIDCNSLEEALPLTDVLYMTRIQKERFQSAAEYELSIGKLILTPDLMTKAKDKMAVMHPLPRVDEISPEVDTDPRAVYFRQAEYGMYIRMALLLKLLEQN